MKTNSTKESGHPSGGTNSEKFRETDRLHSKSSGKVEISLQISQSVARDGAENSSDSQEVWN